MGRVFFKVFLKPLVCCDAKAKALAKILNAEKTMIIKGGSKYRQGGRSLGVVHSVETYKLDTKNIPIVSEFMATINPDFRDKQGAIEQLSSGICWYFGLSESRPKGWILCKLLKEYKTGEIECLGYDDNEALKIGKELQQLVEKSEEWARKEGLVIMRFIMGSRGLSCHLRPLGIPWEELRGIHATDREEFDWFLSMGYVPSGVLPNIYGDNYHGIMLAKRL